MPHAFDTDLLPFCAEFTLSHSQTVKVRVHEELQTSARTPLVTALRMLRLLRAILVTGMFSLFESLLQSEMGWTEPFDRLREYLKKSGKVELAETFNDYHLAINVLKHGQGGVIASFCKNHPNSNSRLSQKESLSSLKAMSLK
jgi:hypothetical protein